ncbi:HepT-like ribonuclease domain-containing protein [Aureibacillus halotolerans]|uniref:Uncharacterized protein with HEPN domain n=1 Tax=Aureibacillus halotolerans TaxID=1508390 RepID=A0A4R6U756_9BACI|nr:DUF86 domain-containing protein [Aureibacillus halotolerans]TDQ42360.1 uncharacterized protein with HEPN domain [Aureibacillus halotolerans]
MKDNKLYVSHILDSLNQIESYCSDGKNSFFQSRLIQDAVIRNLEIIGEATKQLSGEFRKKHDHIPWREMAGLRDILIHDYFGVDLRTVWGVIEKELPKLKKQVQKIIIEW